MDVTHYKDLAGNWWKEIVYNKYQTLKELQRVYETRGAQTWLHLFDGCENKWMLTVLELKEVA